MVMPGVLEIDLHGLNRYQAKVTVESALRRCRAGVYRLRLIHGHTRGDSLKTFLQEEYGSHPRVKRLAFPNEGVTELILREWQD